LKGHTDTRIAPVFQKMPTFLVGTYKPLNKEVLDIERRLLYRRTSSSVTHDIRNTDQTGTSRAKVEECQQQSQEMLHEMSFRFWVQNTKNCYGKWLKRQ